MCQIDVHYGMVKKLALAAGFEEEAAETISFASQYADDATEHKKIFIKKLPKGIPGPYFDPVCTSHTMLKMGWSGTTHEAQMKVYIPFHFYPQGKYDYLVKAGDEGLRNLILSTLEDSTRGLIRLGLQLHAYADTFAHHNFSGRENDLENRVLGLKIWNKRKNIWENSPLYERISRSILPSIGHAQAFFHPDIKDESIWIERERGKDVRANELYFNQLALDVFKIFLRLTNRKLNPMEEITRIMKNLPEKRVCERLYNPLKWRAEALEGNVNWDPFKNQEAYDKESFVFRGDLKWFVFQDEARKHRKYVLDLLKVGGLTPLRFIPSGGLG